MYVYIYAKIHARKKVYLKMNDVHPGGREPNVQASRWCFWMKRSTLYTYSHTFYQKERRSSQNLVKGLLMKSTGKRGDPSDMFSNL